jgi:hypothetical protein
MITENEDSSANSFHYVSPKSIWEPPDVRSLDAPDINIGTTPGAEGVDTGYGKFGSGS